ncbi:MAG: hypothetical protein AABY07_07615, partial [Nanoarchaeota archaeon]
MPISPMGAMAPASVWYTIVKDLILLVVGSLALMIVSKQFKTKDTSFMTAFKVNLVIVVLSFIWGLIIQALSATQSIVPAILNFAGYYCIYIVIALYFIKKFYHTNMTETTSMWVLFIITYLIISLVFAAIQVSLQMKALTQSMQGMPGAGPQGMMPSAQVPV